MQHSPRRGDGCQRPPRQRRRDSHQQHNEQTRPTTYPQYTLLHSAAALQRATAAHLDEELSARRERGQRSTRELCQLLPIARWLHERLACLAAQEGGQV
jgi:hypothetical protein